MNAFFAEEVALDNFAAMRQIIHRRIRHFLCIAGFSTIIFLCVSGCSNYGLTVVKIDPSLYVLPGEGGNSGVFIGDSAVLVIDTKMKQGAERFSRWVGDRAKNKKIIVVNTHIHKDHTGGNHYYTNAEIISGDYGTQFWLANNAREDMPNQWLPDKLEINLGNEVAIIENIGQAHTFDDITVYLVKHKTLFTGDVVLNGYHPYLDEQVGANVDGYLAAMNNMLRDYDIKTVVPGHGDNGDRELITAFRQYFLDMKAVSEDPEQTDAIRKKYKDYLNIPVNKAGFDQTIQFIRMNASLRN